jgi:hypothetical protein
MAPPGWTKSTSRHTFLTAHKQSYLDAHAGNALSPWLENLYREYFKVYHWSLDDYTEPTPGQVFQEPTDAHDVAKADQIKRKKKEVKRFDLCLDEHDS